MENGFIENCFLIEDEGVIKYVSKECRELPSYCNLYELDGIVIPTLVNAHTHLELMDFRDKLNKDGSLELWDWIIKTVKYKRTLDDKGYLKNISSGERALIEKGTSIIGDVRSILPCGPYLNYLKGKLFFEVLGYNDVIFGQKFALFEQFLYTFKSISGLSAGLSIHSLYTTPFSKAKELVKLARSYKMPIMMHLAETVYEDMLFFHNDEGGFHKIFADASFEKKGFLCYADIIDYLDFGRDTFLVHCVNFSKKDWRKVKEREINVVLCPKSNLFWGNKLPDFTEIISLKINFLLGTDSPKTNDNIDVLKEARFMYSKMRRKETAAAILDAVTYRGRRLLGCNDDSFTEGSKCSFLFFPSDCTADEAAEYILSVEKDPIVYCKEYKDEAIERYKK
ncbi:MAG: amidohydrolase family protein [bacterium]